MIYLSTFEVFVISVKNKYERLTGSLFVEDFGSQALIDLRRQYDMGVSQDEAIRQFMNKNARLNACCCESGVNSVFQSQAY